MTAEVTVTADNEQTHALLTRVNTDKPKAADVAALKQLFDEDSRLWRLVGDEAVTAIDSTIKAYHPSSELQRESTRRKIEELKAELGANDATPLERMLIDHAALCWLRLYGTELTYTNRLLAADSHSQDSGIYWEKRLAGAQRRFTRALEALAKVRALTAATRLMESRTEAARAAKTVNSLRTLKALTA
jgi:hypothetical protein